MEGLDRGKFDLYIFGTFIGTSIGPIACPVTMVMLSPDVSEDVYYGVSGFVFIVAFGIIIWAISERLKNSKQNQMMILFTFIPIINLGFLLYLLFTPAP